MVDNSSRMKRSDVSRRQSMTINHSQVSELDGSRRYAEIPSNKMPSAQVN